MVRADVPFPSRRLLSRGGPALSLASYTLCRVTPSYIAKIHVWSSSGPALRRRLSQDMKAQKPAPHFSLAAIFESVQYIATRGRWRAVPSREDGPVRPAPSMSGRQREPRRIVGVQYTVTSPCAREKEAAPLRCPTECRQPIWVSWMTVGESSRKEDRPNADLGRATFHPRDPWVPLKPVRRLHCSVGCVPEKIVLL